MYLYKQNIIFKFCTRCALSPFISSNFHNTADVFLVNEIKYNNTQPCNTLALSQVDNSALHPLKTPTQT